MRNSLTQENNIEGRWKEYFLQLLNGDKIKEVGGDIRRERIGENERVVKRVVREEIIGARKKVKGGKSAAMDGTVVEMLKNGVISITDLLLRIFNKCMKSGGVYRSSIQRKREEERVW